MSIQRWKMRKGVNTWRLGLLVLRQAYFRLERARSDCGSLFTLRLADRGSSRRQPTVFWQSENARRNGKAIDLSTHFVSPGAVLEYVRKS
jgi:hypothetical protein